MSLKTLGLTAALIILGACQQPAPNAPGQQLTWQEKYARDLKAMHWQQHCCRRGGRNNNR